MRVREPAALVGLFALAFGLLGALLAAAIVGVG